MKILVTGSSGFVGTHLVKKLSVEHEVIGYDLKNGQDILDETLLSEKLKNIDVVFHLAAFISAEESWRKPREYFNNNSLGTLSVIKNSIDAGVKQFVYFSSAAV
jgi:UDP-glucose 4-epimerase